MRRNAVQIICAIASLVKSLLSTGSDGRIICPAAAASSLQLHESSTDEFVDCSTTDIYKLSQDTLFELLAMERNPPLLGVHQQTHSVMLGALVFLAFLETDPCAPMPHCAQTLGEILTMIALHLYLTDLTIVEVSVDCMNAFAQSILLVNSIEKVCEAI